MELSVYNLEAKEQEKISLNDEIFSGKVNKALLHLSVLHYLAKFRAGTHSTKTKSEVKGGGKKPYQQKSTGNARRGSSRSPLIVGGGVAFGPKPRKYDFKMNKKMKDAAMRSALSNKKDYIVVLKDLDIKESKTKAAVKVLKSFKLASSALFIDEKVAGNFTLASRNIPKVKTISLKEISVYDLIKYEKLFITKTALKKLEETLA